MGALEDGVGPRSGGGPGRQDGGQAAAGTRQQVQGHADFQLPCEWGMQATAAAAAAAAGSQL